MNENKNNKQTLKEYVYVISKDGQPLMPTVNRAKVRILLKQGRARVVRKTPFTIQLLYDTPNKIQSLKIGDDTGHTHNGISIIANGKEIYAEEHTLKNDTSKNLTSRAEKRHSRRSRKTRYRKPRFLNRKNKKGRLMPSVQGRVDEHVQVLERIAKFLPLRDNDVTFYIEVGQFDMRKMKDPDVSGEDYQHGPLENYYNVREYVLARDKHICQCCKGKSKDAKLETHHIIFRSHGGSDSPDNLVTLCHTCHSGFHDGLIELPKRIKPGMKFSAPTQMNVMRPRILSAVQTAFPSARVVERFGYETKLVRFEHDIPKTHVNDALCCTGSPDVVRCDVIFMTAKKRRHNRQLHKCKFERGHSNYRKPNQVAREVFGFRLWDVVSWDGVRCFVAGRRSDGRFKLVDFDGNTLAGQLSCKKLYRLEYSNGFLIERRDTGEQFAN